MGLAGSALPLTLSLRSAQTQAGTTHDDRVARHSPGWKNFKEETPWGGDLCSSFPSRDFSWRVRACLSRPPIQARTTAGSPSEWSWAATPTYTASFQTATIFAG